jgi:hypothetical protein
VCLRKKIEDKMKKNKKKGGDKGGKREKKDKRGSDETASFNRSPN